MWLISQEVLELWVHRVPERDEPRFLLTIKQWNVLAYMLTDEDCPVFLLLMCDVSCLPSSVTGIKALKSEGTESGASLKEPVEQVSLILLIFSEKKGANMSARLLSEL